MAILGKPWNKRSLAGFTPLEYGIDSNFEVRNMRGYY